MIAHGSPEALTGLFYGGGLKVLEAQIVRSAIVCVATFVSAMAMFAALNALSLLRVSDEGELIGLDLDQHGIWAYPSTRSTRRSERLHSSGDAMQMIQAIIRPDKVDAVTDALTKIGVAGLTVMEARGHGHQKGHTAIYRGKEYAISLLPRMSVETVVCDDMVDAVVQAIASAARTGEIGDGRIFVSASLSATRSALESGRSRQRQRVALVFIGDVHVRRTGEHGRGRAVGQS